MNDPEVLGREADQRDWLDHAVRVGLVAYGVGVTLVGYAANTAGRGWTEKFAEHLETEGKLGNSGAANLLHGQVGHIAKGVSLAIVGGLFCFARARHLDR
jgi:hypothetical protein